MTAKLQPPKTGFGPEGGPPSTQFAATIVGMPGFDPDSGHGDLAGPESGGVDASSGHSASPDVVTDIGGLPSEVPDPALAPTISHIGRYALKHPLGSGGLGTVFEAWDPLLSRAVAVKTLQFDTDPQSRGSLDGLFLNEARAAAGLNHRYIVTIHDAGLSPHGVYIAMERLYGRDLQRALADGWRPTVLQAVQLVRRITEALAYAHARGVVHCDIKPANIFLQRRDKPKVLDFGIARIVHGGILPALDGAVVGSPRYRAPEQLNRGEVDARTDLFSLGVVFYELLTGRQAFVGDTLAAINRAVLEHDPLPAHEVDPSVPAEISAICLRLMQRAPEKRYTCASELASDLRRWVQENLPRSELAETTITMKALVARPVAPPARRWLSPLLLAAAAAMLAVAALATIAWQRAERAPAAPLAPSTPDLAPAPVSAPATASPAAPTAAAVLATEPVTPTEVQSDVSTAAAPVGVPAAAVPPLAGPRAPARPSIGESPARRAPPPAAEPTAPSAREDTIPPVAAAALGTVQLAITPWGDIEVNGKASGTSPPVTRLSLPEGTHTITVRNADFAPHSVQVQVSADRPLLLRHRFGP